MAFEDTNTSYAAQAALETASVDEQVVLVNGLRGHIRQAMEHKHANFVVQKAVQVMTGDRIGFIPEELEENGCAMAKHKYKCRLIERMLEHMSLEHPRVKALLAEVLDGADELCFHTFGGFTLSHFLEHGLPENRHHIAGVLLKDRSIKGRRFLVELALQRIGSTIVENALRFCSSKDCQALAKQLQADDRDFLDLATGRYGSHIVATMINSTVMAGDKEQVRTNTLQKLVQLKPDLELSERGKTLCADLPASVVYQ
jgi:hypothetical protein